MPLCFFASDLHGRTDRYDKLFAAIRLEGPAGLFLGGDLLPHGLARPAGGRRDFINGFLAHGFQQLRRRLGPSYPQVFLILGNDDPRLAEAPLLEAGAQGLWHYAHMRRLPFGEFEVLGYACVPPTPFQLKDWERWDVSRFVDPGCIPPDAGLRTVPVPDWEARFATIQEDLAALAPAGASLGRTIALFHTPPYKTLLDRADLDGRMVDHVPLDVHVGSIAVRRFIETRRPPVTLHGHIHESARLTGSWRELLEETHALSAAHDGPELALVRFDPRRPADATRELL